MKKAKIEHHIVKTLTQERFTIATAESCTGGLLAGCITSISGSSKVFHQGFITYSNNAKIELINVRKETLKKHGAVSSQVAKEMAKGVAHVSNADIGVSITGIAGPNGGTKKKPVGLVYIGCYYKGKTVVKKYIFKGNRKRIRKKSVLYALKLTDQCIQ